MGDRVISFADIVGDEEEFFRTYFSKRVLYRPRGIDGDPRQILSIADLDDIVHQEGMRSSLLRMLGGGVPAIGEQLTSQLEMRRAGKTIDDAVDASKIYAHFRAGKTLIHGGLNLTRPNLRALAHSMTDRLAAKSEAVAFLTRPASAERSTAIRRMSTSFSWKERRGGRSGRRRRCGGRVTTGSPSPPCPTPIST